MRLRRFPTGDAVPTAGLTPTRTAVGIAYTTYCPAENEFLVPVRTKININNSYYLIPCILPYRSDRRNFLNA